VSKDTGNPWLSIPAADYEAHMSLPRVGQLGALSSIFAGVYRMHQPARLLVLGCTTGNGLEHVDAKTTRQVALVDINPAYLGLAGQRHGQRLPKLELRQLDLGFDPLPTGPWDLVYAGLLFEYVKPEVLLPKIAGVLAPGGRLLTVLQLPTVDGPISKTPYSSIGLLAPILRLVEPADFQACCEENALAQEREWRHDLPSGKQFWCAVHVKPDPAITATVPAKHRGRPPKKVVPQPE
jgi:SAM-dependent methyltransferase